MLRLQQVTNDLKYDLNDEMYEDVNLNEGKRKELQRPK